MMIEPPEIVKKTYTCEQSPDSHDVNTLKSDHNNYLRMNKKTSTLDRCTSSKSSLEGIFIGCLIFVIINDCFIDSELNIWFCS